MHKQILTLAMLSAAAGSTAAGAVDIGANTTVGASVFLDASYIKNQQNGVDVNPTGTGFDVKRGYLIIDHKFNDMFSANLTTDVQYSTASTATVTTPAIRRDVENRRVRAAETFLAEAWATAPRTGSSMPGSTPVPS